MPTQAQVEAAIGCPPDDPEFRLTAANRDLVRQWLTLAGFDPGRAASARDGTLAKAYSLPHYRRALLTRGDYNPLARKEPMDIPKPVCPQCQDMHWIEAHGRDGRTMIACPACLPKRLQERKALMAEAEPNRAPAAPEPGMGEPALTEARVIALIRRELVSLRGIEDLL